LGFLGIVSPPTEQFTQLVFKDVPQLLYIADLTVAHTTTPFRA